MTLLQIIVLAMVQGFSEFWPVSSSGHLILVPVFLGWPKQDISFDVAVHMGTLIAVVVYFWRDVHMMLRDWSASILQRKSVGQSKLAWYLLLATIPVGASGLLFHDAIDRIRENPLIVGSTLIGYGVLLAIADWLGKRVREIGSVRFTDAMIIGFAQALALIPGTSRSGITMTAGLFLGLTREAAARFSFLLAIPSIAMAGAYEGLKLLKTPQVDWAGLSIGVLVSAITAFFCIYYFMRLLSRFGMWPFVIYRIFLGFVVFYFLLWR